jgi:predicted phosphoadenosine phosphosulfate sulfurtransferase
MIGKIEDYINKWKEQGYPIDIPDEVPNELMKNNLAPSYKAIAIAILKNDHGLLTLGNTAKPSKWYSFFKKIELNS